MVQRVYLSRQWVYQFLALLLVCALGTAVQVSAQGAGAVIVGTIADAQGGRLPGVTLTLRNVDSGNTRVAVTEADGRYRLAGLPPGRYDLTAELQGFAPTEVKDLTLTIGLELRRDFTMALQGLQESLTVTGESPVVETTRTEVAAVVTQQQIDSLPISNRQPISLALLLPGTSMDSTSVRRSQANIGAGGSANTMNAYHLDGAMNWSSNSGQQHLEVPQASIQEFKVNVSQASAEYTAVGGVVLVVTKSGINRFNGEVFEYFRGKSLNTFDKLQKARHDQFGDPKPDFTRHSPGGAFGGPVIKDRLHFFVALERAKETTSFTVNSGAPQFYSALEGTFPSTYERSAYFARGDFQINPQQHLFLRYASDIENISCENCGATNAATAGTHLRSPRDSNVLGHTWVLGNRALNEVRAQLPPSHLDSRSAPSGLPIYRGPVGDFDQSRWTEYGYVYQFPSLNWGNNSDSILWTDRMEVRDDFSLTLGSHSWKFGGAFVNLTAPEEQAAAKGTWVFDRDQFFDGSAAAIAKLTSPIQFTASFPPLMRELRNKWFQAYIQDEWRPVSNLTLNLGLRYDNQYKAFNNHLDLTLAPRLAELINPKSRGDNNNVGPRAGFAWDITGDGRSVMRGAYGVYYQYLMQGGLRPEMTTLRQTSITIRNPTYPDPYGGRTPESFAVASAAPNVSIVADDIRNARAQDVNLGYSYELRPNLAVHFDGVYAHVTNLTTTANVNTPVTPTGARPRPTWGRIVTLRSDGEHKYKAFYTRLEKRYSDRYQFLLSYTLSKQDNTGNGTNPAITDFYNPGLDFGPGTADRRHAFVGSGSYLLPYDIMLGAVWTLRSTMPFSARAGRDLNNDGAATTDYVPGTTRNMGNRDTAAFLTAVNAWRVANARAPISAEALDTNDYKRVDVRASKSFALGANRKLELIAQVFNLLGRDNLGGIAIGWQENALSDSFGKIRSVQPRQQGELAVRFVF